MRRHDAVFHGGGIDQGIVVVQPGDRVAVLRACEVCFIGRVTGHGNDLRRPASEGVSVFRSRGLAGGRMRRHDAVFHGGGIDQGIVVVQPGDRVAVLRACEVCFIGRVTGYGSDFRRPACEGVGVLRVRGFFRRAVLRSIIAWRCTIGKRFVIDFGFTVHPGNGVTSQVFAELRHIGRVTGYGNDLRRPACEGVGVLRGGGFRRVVGLRNVGRGSAVIIERRFFQHGGAVLIDEGHAVFVDCGGIGGRIGHIAGDVSDCR